MVETRKRERKSLRFHHSYPTSIIFSHLSFSKGKEDGGGGGTDGKRVTCCRSRDRRDKKELSSLDPRFLFSLKRHSWRRLGIIFGPPRTVSKKRVVHGWFPSKRERGRNHPLARTFPNVGASAMRAPQVKTAPTSRSLLTAACLFLFCKCGW